MIEGAGHYPPAEKLGQITPWLVSLWPLDKTYTISYAYNISLQRKFKKFKKFKEKTR